MVTTSEENVITALPSLDKSCFQLRRISAEEFKQRLSMNSHILNIVLPHLRWISNALPEVELLFGDPDGIILFNANELESNHFLKWAEPGTDWSEGSLGSNALGLAIRSGRVESIYGIEHHEKELRSCLSIGVPLHNSDGILVGVLALIATLDHRASDYILLVSQAAQAIEREFKFLQNQKPDLYLPIITGISCFLSHDLRNALAALHISLDLLGHQALNEKVIMLLNRCKSVHDRLLSIVDGLGALGGGQRAQLNLIDIVPIVELIVERMKLRERFEVHLDITGPEHPQIVCSNSSLLQWTLRILLTNTSDMLANGSKLGIRTQFWEQGVRLTVWDEGPGILSEYWNDVFLRPFSTKGREGVSLLLVRSILEGAHCGQVSFAPNFPSGAQFHLDFPLPQ